VTRWAAFVGLTSAIVSLFLLLARLSQSAIDPDSATAVDHISPAGLDPGVDGDGETVAVRPLVDPAASAVGDASSAVGGDGPPVADASTTLIVANVALTQGVFGALVLAGGWLFDVPAWAFGLGTDLTGLPALGVGIGFGSLLWAVNELTVGGARRLGHDADETLRSVLAPQSIGGWILLFGVGLPIIAGVEELLFRGALIGVASVGLNTSPWAMAVVSSLAFGVGHGAQGRLGIAVTGGLGFALAAGFILTNSLLVVVVAHYVVNALELLVHEGLGYG
jgi:membrane protease YdiL (CAAX protease family)